jgi:hypothetical protein
MANGLRPSASPKRVTPHMNVLVFMFIPPFLQNNLHPRKNRFASFSEILGSATTLYKASLIPKNFSRKPFTATQNSQCLKDLEIFKLCLPFHGLGQLSTL